MQILHSTKNYPAKKGVLCMCPKFQLKLYNKGILVHIRQPIILCLEVIACVLHGKKR